ncbi:hypothetical protein BRADI_4g23956v3 [Brachypodium distachyon]|uniref:Uncharacterized protein n=1 Tax=Brachypodium distachyon TaxID=15368 RepID=A0A0Q3ENX5_BRADI|nr:hypothetical protein BRADI_4g23956v3 [Brachypodium distachyon]
MPHVSKSSIPTTTTTLVFFFQDSCSILGN